MLKVTIVCKGRKSKKGENWGVRDLKTLKRMICQMYNILNHKQRIQMIGMFIIIIVGSMFELLSISIILPFMEAILSPNELRKKPYISVLIKIFKIRDNLDMLILIGGGIIIIYLVKNIYLSFSAYMQALYSNNMQRSLSVLMLKSYLNHPYSFFVEHSSGEIMRGISGDVSGVYVVIINLFKFLSELLVIIAIAIYLMITDIVLALGTITAGMSCLIVIVIALKKKLSKMAELYRDNSAIQSKWVVQAISGIKDVMVFNKREYFAKEYDLAYRNAAKANTNYTFAGALPERLIEAFCVSGIIITILIRLSMGLEPDEFVPQMAIYAMGAFRILPSISRMTAYINNFIYYRPMVEATYSNIFEAREYLKNTQKKMLPVDKEYKNILGSISIRNISFKYVKREKGVLEDCSLEIRKGQVVGIIGKSGVGKSTLADILLRLYMPQKGGIYMDGVDINTIPDSWDKLISYVPQAVFLLDDTIKANIAFGEEANNEEKIWEMLDKASLKEFVQALPDGLNTIVGERGVKFSGGQRQRIAIARALYSEPQILILDEATSALDNETELAVMNAIDGLAGKITLIIIAHRVTTLKRCDKIYEVKKGKIVERRKEEVIP